MKPTVESLAKACPNAETELIREHLSRLDSRYFDRFSREEISGHLAGLAALTARRPIAVLVDRVGSLLECTILSYDYPSLFSVITGVLTSRGFDIESGSVFTYHKAGDWHTRPRGMHRVSPTRRRRDLSLRRRRIVDTFRGRLASGVSVAEWSRSIEQQLQRLVGFLENDGDRGLERARREVHELVAARLEGLSVDAAPVLYPVQIGIVPEAESATRLRVIAQDTPAFLYSLSNALAVQGMSIENVQIETVKQRVHDLIDVVDLRGLPVTDETRLNQLKLAVLLTKQFTYFLPTAPDPSAALTRFDSLVTDLVAARQTEWLDMMADPRVLKDLARLLGASEYLWEDFIRLQHESLRPILRPAAERHVFAAPSEQLRQRVAKQLEVRATYEEKRAALNEFKDKEIFLIDLDHILDSRIDFEILSARLTSLAEAIVDGAVRVVYDDLVRTFGEPRTIAGLPAHFAVCGLGKLGGAALGYASDIELQFIYDDNGQTAGPRSITNAEFFDRLVKSFSSFIETKREGIFNLDLRLRPFGNDGPLACSLDSWCRYYGPEGGAHSYERLSLVRLRSVAGDRDIGARIERLRDEIVYQGKLIVPSEIQQLRRKQYQTLTRPGALNAKFSPGGLVDLEYDVQLLQVIHGADTPFLRTPYTHEALERLAGAGVLEEEERSHLQASYAFLRRLINGLRMLRGNAKDLFLPSADSLEFTHLGRRMGYRRREDMSPAQQLQVDFESHTAVIRQFVERHFGRRSLPGQTGNLADLVLSESFERERAERMLAEHGFSNPSRAYVNLRSLAGDGADRRTFARLAILAGDMVRSTPDPDMALNNWDRFVESHGGRARHFHSLLRQPKRLEIMLALFSSSQFLADAMIRDQAYLEWVIAPANLHRQITTEEVESVFDAISAASSDSDTWQAGLRYVKRREMLRIAVRDICLHEPIESVTRDLSRLAEGILRATLSRALGDHFGADADHTARKLSILAFGKLGGGELNYSSDVDLLAICDDSVEGPLRRELERIVERIVRDLSRYTAEGAAYRVDLRLRPHGAASPSVQSISTVTRYYGDSAALWEIQAALKLRPIAGNQLLGRHFLAQLSPLLRQRREAGDVAAAIRSMRERSRQHRSLHLHATVDLKNGEGGIRDIEFLVQGLQLIHAHTVPDLLTGNTLEGLQLLAAHKLLAETDAAALHRDYVLLRRAEHFLQLFEDRQTHELPRSEEQLEALGRRVLGKNVTAAEFTEVLDSCFDRVSRNFREQLGE